MPALEVVTFGVNFVQGFISACEDALLASFGGAALTGQTGGSMTLSSDLIGAEEWIKAIFKLVLVPRSLVKPTIGLAPVSV
jgi:hypothetical protein